MNIAHKNDILLPSNQIVDGDSMADPKAKFKSRYAIVLTIQEGETFEKILIDNDCQNPSQLVKKIVRGELGIFNLDSSGNPITKTQL